MCRDFRNLKKRFSIPTKVTFWNNYPKVILITKVRFWGLINDEAA